MKFIEIDEVIGVADEIGLLSNKMRCLNKIGSHPLHATLLQLSLLLNNKIKWALCGGLAVGLHAKPRGTQDVDILLESDAAIDEVVKLTQSSFRHTRAHALVHKQIGTEVDLVTPEFIKVDSPIISAVINAALVVSFDSTTIPVVNSDGLVALKLGRGSLQDVADIEAIIKNNNIDLSQYNLGTKEKNLFEDIKKKVTEKVDIKEEELS